MPRVSEVPVSALPDALREVFDAQQKQFGALTWQRVLAHRPAQLGGLAALMGTFAHDSVVPVRLLEIAIVTVSRINACRHCEGRHSVRLANTGLAAESIETLLDAEPVGLTPFERTVRDYAMAVTEHAHRIDDALFEKLREGFSEPQIVELTMRIALAGFFNRFNNALGVELDADHEAAGSRLGLNV